MKLLPAAFRASLLALSASCALPTLAAPGTALRIDTADAERPDAPAIAVAADGSFVVAWQATTQAAGLEVRARRFSAAGLPLGAPFTVNPQAAGDQSAPSVAIAGDGSLWIAWNEQAPGRNGVWVQGYAANGATLGLPIPVNTPVRAIADAPQLLADGAAGFAISWLEPLPAVTRVTPAGCKPARCTTTTTLPLRLSLRRYGAGGAGATPPVGVADFELASAAGARPHGEQGTRVDRHRLHAGEAGALGVAWQQTTLPALGRPRIALRLREFAGDGTAGRAASLLRRVAGCTQDSGFQVLQVLGVRTTVLLEGDGDGGCALDLVERSRYTDRRQRVDAPVFNSAGGPALAADAAGGLVVSWGSTDRWMAQRYAAGGAALGGNLTLLPVELLGTVDYQRVAIATGSGGHTVAVARKVKHSELLTQILAVQF